MYLLKKSWRGDLKDRVTEDIFKFEKDTLFSSDTSTVLSIVYLYISAVEHESS